MSTFVALGVGFYCGFLVASIMSSGAQADAVSEALAADRRARALQDHYGETCTTDLTPERREGGYPA